MIPQIIDVTETDNGFFYTTVTNEIVPRTTVCASYKVSAIDIENSAAAQKIDALSYILKGMDRSLTAKLGTSCSYSNNVPLGHGRAAALPEVGFLQQECTIHFEVPMSGIGKGTLSLLKELRMGNSDPHLYRDAIEKMQQHIPFDQFKDAGMPLLPCTFEEIEQFFPYAPMPVSFGENGLVIGDQYVGIVKLHKLTSGNIEVHTLADRKMDLPPPFDIVTTVKQPHEAVLKENFNRTRNQEDRKKDRKAIEKATAKDDAIADVDNRGIKYLFFELHVVIRRNSPQELAKDLRVVAQKLSGLGDFIVETPAGAAPSFASTLPGGNPHLLKRTIEKDSVLPCYIPWFSRGVSTISPPSKTALAYHRRDMSIDYYDSSLVESNGMRNIFAQSGRGKSVFLNLSIEAIAQDERSYLYVTDIKGSHTNTILDLGGEVHTITLDKPSPINHFRHLSNSPSETTLSILNSSLAELLLDDGETKLSTADEYYVNRALMEYAQTGPKNASVPEFIKFIFPTFDPKQTLFPDFPRKEHLLRYSPKGILKNVFTQSCDEPKSRINYFNIGQISTARNSGITKGAVSATLAEFWITAEKKPKNEQIHYIVDEAPVVITGNFTSLTHTSTQTRKENGFLTLVAQKVENLVVGGNTTLLSNAGTNIFLGRDDKLFQFKEALGLSDTAINEILELQFKQGEFSQFFVNNELNSHTAQLILTKSEYWRTSTSPNDLTVIDNLQAQFPNIPRNKIAQLIGLNEAWR